MDRPEFVLFDCDGVLVDSESVTNSVLQVDLARHGLQIPLEQISSLFVGGTMKGVFHRAREMGAHLPDDWLEHIYTTLFSALSAQCEIVPGVAQLLDRLDMAGIGYAIGSNGPIAKMEVTLVKTGLWRRFDGRIYSAHDCAAAKPAPDVYLKAAKLAGVLPQGCVVIEDSATGARAGRAAGMRVFGFAADAAEGQLEPYCDVIFQNMKELPRLLGV